MGNKRYTINVEFTFKGKVDVYAENKIRAKEIIKQNLGMTTSSRIYTSGADTDNIEQEGVADWVFPVHPDQKIK